MRPSVPSPELSALAACCRLAVEESGDARFEGSQALHALAARHRVAGLYASAIGDRSATDKVVAASLVQAAECARLARSLEDHGPLFLKGLAVAALGYRAPLLKESADIDLLVKDEAVYAAAEILTKSGYVRSIPAPRKSLRRWYRVSNQSVWTRGVLAVELHTRSLTVPFEAREPPQRVEVTPAVTLSTFGDRDLYIHLVLHGALSGWFRLKWLVDLYAFLARRTASIRDFHEAAERRGAGEASAAALILLEKLFGFPPFGFEADRPRTRRLVALSLALLDGPEPTVSRWGTLAIHRSYLAVRPGLRSAASRGLELIGQRWLR